jgi:hypothetical protein
MKGNKLSNPEYFTMHLFYCQPNKHIMLAAMLTTGDTVLLDDSCQNFAWTILRDGGQRIVHRHRNFLQVGGPRILVQCIAVNRLLLVTFKGGPGNVCLPSARKLVTANNYTVHRMSQFKLKRADMK